MDKSRSYYRLVYKRFGHKEVRLQQADHEELGGEADSATVNVEKSWTSSQKKIRHHLKKVGHHPKKVGHFPKKVGHRLKKSWT